MSDYQVGMMTLYAVTFLIATPRGRQWLAMGLLAFLATTVYWRSGLPFASAFALICDATVCFAIYFSYRRSWEKAVYLCFLFMATAGQVSAKGGRCSGCATWSGTRSTRLFRSRTAPL